MPYTLNNSTLRPMQPGDLEQVLELQHQAYPPCLHESPASFKGKLLHYPATTWVVAHEEHVLAYLFAQPSRKGYPPPLNDTGHEIPNPDTLHLHDMAVSPRLHGRGFAQALARACLQQGIQHGFHWAALVAVQNSAPFWSRLGFSVAESAKSLTSYGDDSAYLIKAL